MLTNGDNQSTKNEPIRKDLVSVRDVEKWLKTFSDKDCLDVQKLHQMVNFFAKGVVTDFSNLLYDMSKKDLVLEHNPSVNCRRSSCYTWQIVDEEKNVLAETEDLLDWIFKRPNVL